MRHSVRLVAAGVIGAAVVAGTSVLASGATAPRGAPGVTATKVNVGAIVSQSGPLAADFAPYLSGVKAYFDYVNGMGGVHNRQIDLAYPLDDASNPTTDITDAETLVNADKAFAIVGVSTPFFNAPQVPLHHLDAGLRVRDRQRVGWTEELLRGLRLGPQLQLLDPVLRLRREEDEVDQRRGDRPQLPGLPGRVQGRPGGPQEVQDQGRLPEHQRADRRQLEHRGEEDAHANVNYVINCMDVNSDISLSKALSNFGVKSVQLWLDGYDRSILSRLPAIRPCYRSASSAYTSLTQSNNLHSP